MMTYLRGRYGLDSFDRSKDAAILELSPEDMVRECTGWKIGDPGWADTIAGLMVAVGAKPEDF